MRDAVLVGLSAAHAGVLIAAPSVPVVAIGLWWNANTISHNFVHQPFFASSGYNGCFSIFLTLLLGFPHSLWRRLHLRHHGGERRSIRRSTFEMGETALALVWWLTLIVIAPRFVALVYLPGFAIGLGLCQLHGFFEHDRGTTSHYGRLYNLLFFNDGYHVEHHRRPYEHWSKLPEHRDGSTMPSRWPPVLRWLAIVDLNVLERLVLRCSVLQRYVIATHERVFRKVLSGLPPIREVTIVGGGLFPRTALILRRLLPDASLTVVDADASNLAVARQFLDSSVRFRHDFYELHGRGGEESCEVDLVVLPLAFVGSRERAYRDPPARVTLVHDWVWNRTTEGVTISWLLLKRLNVVSR